jgi:hypothetical protein
MAVSFSITRTTTRFHDSNGNGVKDPGELDFDSGEVGVYDPGDILYTRIKITNNGSDPATGVTVQDVTAGTTPVANPNDAADLSYINISPIASNDTFTAIGNTVLRVGPAGSTVPTINDGESTLVVGSLTSNDVGSLAGDDVADFKIDTVTSGVSAKGGTFNIFADGSFNYVNDGDDTIADLAAGDTFTYTIRDKGMDGTYGTADDLTSTATVKITFAEQSPGVPHRVWYVDSNAAAGGDGTSANPFQTMTALNGVTGDGTTNDDLDQAGEYIYVENSANPAVAVTGPITLEGGQQLIGDGAALIVAGVTLATAGSNSALTAASGTVVTLGSGNTISGINIVGTGSAVGMAGSGFGALAVSNTAISTQTGAILNLANGTSSGISFNSLSSTGTVGGNAPVVRISNLDSGTFNANSLSIAGSSDVGSAGLKIEGGSSSTFTFGTTAIANTRSANIDLDGANGSVTFSSVTLSGSVAGAGLSIANATNAVTVNAGTITADAPVDAVKITGGTGAVTVAAAISKSNGGNVVDISGHSGGAVAFSGNITSTNGAANGIVIANSSGTIDFTGQSISLSTGSSNAVELTNNTGATINFKPAAGGNGLDITTTSGKGFTATGGGTVTVEGTSNTILSTTGTALEVANTNIGANDLTFVSIGSSGGSSTGIILDTTGSAGGLHVTGNGSAGTGGTIANKTGVDGSTSTGIGIYLNNTADVQLAWMQLNGFENFGIRGLQVNGFSLSNSVVEGTGAGKNGTNNAFDEGSISFGNVNGTNGLTGTATITNTKIHDGFENGFALFNSSGTVNLVMDNVDVTGAGNDGILTQNFGTATVNIEVKNSELYANVGDHFNATADNAANLNVLFGNNGFNTLTGGAPGQLGGGITIQTGIGWSGNGSANISNNPISGSTDTPINVNIGGTGTFNASIINNIIGKDGVAGSGTPVGSNKDAIRVVANGDKATDGTPDGGTLNALISGNTIQQVSGRGIYVIGRDGGTAADPIRLNVTIIGNTLRQSLNSTGQGILLESGASSSPIADFVILHADIGGAGARANIFSDDWGVNDQIDRDEIRILHSIPGNRVILTGYQGGPTDDIAVRTYLAGRNTLPAGGAAGTSRAAANTWETGGAPTQPISASEFALLPLELYQLAAEEVEPTDGGAVATPEVETGAGSAAPAAPSGPTVIDDGILSQAELDLILEAAIQRWAAAGASDEQIAAMRAVSVSVADLAGLTLGQSDVGSIVLDSDAAGWRWFIDSTPGDDSEYAGSGSRLLAADNLGLAGTRIDLLTVLTHELGHQIGLSDLSAPGSGDELMFGTIGAGERRLPGSDDLAHAGSSPVAGAFAFAPITLGTIPAGQTVIVEYRQTIDAPGEDRLVGSWTGQTFVDSDQTVVELSNAESGNVDGLALGDRIFNDNNKNGLYDAGDSTFAGVVLTLYADTNNNGSYDEGVDLYVGYTNVNNTPGYQQGTDTPAAPGSGTPLTATTNATGHYSFSGLAPGDYIVRVDASNFQAGGTLFGRVSTPGVKDPNDTNADGNPNVVAPADVNVDNDDNGEQFLIGQAGTYAASRAIRLDYGQETVAGPTGPALDTNNSLDLAFFAPNAPPVIGSLNGDTGTFTENGAAVFLDTGVNATVTDGDSANFADGTLSITWAAQTGDNVGFASGVTLDGSNNVSVGATNVGVATFAPGSVSIALNSNANAANIQTLIRNLQFDSIGQTPVAGTRTFTITLVDGDGKDGGLGNDTATATTTVTVVPVSDAPEGADRTGTGLQDSTGAAYAFTVADFATGFADPNDSPANVFAGVRITTLPSASAGTIYFDSNLSDATPGSAIAAGDSFTKQDLIDGKLTFVGAAGSGGMAMSFTFQVIDDGSTANGGVIMDASANTFSATIAAGNSAPVLDLDGNDSSAPAATGGFKTSYSEGGAAAAVGDSDVTITDSNPADVIVSATITITNPESGDKLDVGTLPTGVTKDASSTDTMVKLVASPGVSRADFEAAIESVTFSNTGDDPTDKGTNLSRSVSVVVNDGNADSNTATATIAVTDVNDAPTATNSTITAVEDTHRTLSAGDFGYADADGVVQSVTISAVTGGAIYFDADGAGNASTPQLRTLPDTFTTQDLANGRVSFKADADANGTPAGTITFTVTDDDGAASAPSNVLTVNVTAVNDTPVLTTPSPVAATEQTAVQLLPAGSVSDADLDALNGGAGDYKGAQFSVNRNSSASTDDVFTLVAGPNFTIDGINLKTTGGQIFATISANNPGLIVISFTSSEAIATSALVDEVIQAVRYTNVSNTPPASVDLAVGFTDGSPNAVQGSGASGLDVNLVTVNIAAVNDVPTVTPADTTVTGTEDTDLVFKSTNGNAITVADADNATLTVTLTVSKGTLKLFQTTGLSVTGDGTGTVKVTGSAADINAALEGLVYRGNLNYEGSDMLAIEADDGAAIDTENVAITLGNDGFIDGDSGNNILNGTPQTDIFRLQQGGNDTANGLGSNDAFYFGAAFTAADTVNGGDGIDVLILQGNYSAGLTFGTGATSNISSIESISLFPGSLATYGDTSGTSYSYNLTMLDGNVDAGALLKVNGSGLRAGENFTFDGSAETNGQFIVYGGRGTDTLKGGAMSDSFVFNFDRFTSGDTVNGGSGYDVVYLRGDYTIDFNSVGFAGSLVNVESVGLLSFADTSFAGGGDGEFDYSITWNNAMLAAGQTITFNGSRLGAEENMDFNGSSESDGGKFRLFGGGGNDFLAGGSGADLIVGGRRGDTLTGGAGNDVFRYDSVEDSNSTEADGIQDFNLGDLIDLSRIDANTLVDGDQAFTFIGNAQFSGTAGELRFENVSMGGPVWRIFGDVNGDGASDFEVVLLINPPDPITSSDFIL